MTRDFTFELPSSGKTRYSAGKYDQGTATPKYTIEISASSHVRDQVNVKQFLVGGAGEVTWGWEIQNKSTWPAFIIVKKDGVLVTSPSSASADDA